MADLRTCDEALFLAPPEPMPAIEASFDNAFVGVGDLPCRKLFRRTMADRVGRAAGGAGAGSSTSWDRWRPAGVQLVLARADACRAACRVRCRGARRPATTRWVCRPAAARGCGSTASLPGRLTPFTRNRPQRAEIGCGCTRARTCCCCTWRSCASATRPSSSSCAGATARPAVLAVPGDAEVLEQLRRHDGGGCASIARLMGPSRCGCCCRSRQTMPLTFRLRGVGAGNAIPKIAERVVTVPAGASEVGVRAGYELSARLSRAGRLGRGRRDAARPQARSAGSPIRAWSPSR